MSERSLEEAVVHVVKYTTAVNEQPSNAWVMMTVKFGLGVTVFVVLFLGCYVYHDRRRRNREYALHLARQTEQSKVQEQERADRIQTQLNTMAWSKVTKDLPKRFSLLDLDDTASSTCNNSDSERSVKIDLPIQQEELDLEAPPSLVDGQDYDIDCLIDDDKQMAVQAVEETACHDEDSDKTEDAAVEDVLNASVSEGPQAVAPRNLMEDIDLEAPPAAGDAVLLPSASEVATALTADNTTTNTSDGSDYGEEEGEECCYICLARFEDDDQVTVSNNGKCQHFYHQECISSWLMKQDGCPVCRRNYLDPESGYLNVNRVDEDRC